MEIPCWVTFTCSRKATLNWLKALLNVVIYANLRRGVQMFSQISRIPDLIRKFWAKKCGLYAGVYGTSGWREVLWELSFLAKNTTQCPLPGLQPGPLNLGMSTLTMRPPRLDTWAVIYLGIFIFFVGTKTYSFVDGDCTESEAAYLLAISEKVDERYLHHTAVSQVQLHSSFPCMCTHLLS